MKYILAADWIIFPADGHHSCTDTCCGIDYNETAWCIKDKCVSRFRNGRHYAMAGKKFIQALQKALEQYDESGLHVGANGDIVNDDGYLVACRRGFYEIVDYGFVDAKTLKYTGKRVTMDDIEFAFRRWSWISYLYYAGRLQK